ncbi:hypothetical protein GmHk_18G052677 [Glycine max]|nr:hypothetical protein GmHk_18G052677 [Glycine max]
MSSSSHTSHSSARRPNIICGCNMAAPLISGTTSCDFFEWHDPLINPRLKCIIVSFMRRVVYLKNREAEMMSRLNDMKRREISPLL